MIADSFREIEPATNYNLKLRLKLKASDDARKNQYSIASFSLIAAGFLLMVINFVAMQPHALGVEIKIKTGIMLLQGFLIGN